MTKEKLRDGLLKLSYGISGELDEYQRQRLDHLGNSGYLLLTLFTPLLLLVAMVLALTTTYKIAFLFAFISILTLFIVVTWYFYLVMGKERVLINELPTKELKKTKRWVVKRGIIIGLVAALVEAIVQVAVFLANAGDSLTKVPTVAQVMIYVVLVFNSLFFGLLVGCGWGWMYWRNLKKGEEGFAGFFTFNG